MKNLVNKVRHHGRKVTIHLKRHHRKYLFGALCSGILALIAVHTASTINNIFANTYSQELLEGFIYAKSRGLTDAEDIDNANLSDSVSKIELADIISNYSINILNLELDDTKGCDLPSDVSGELNAEYHSGYTNLCQLGILIETGVDFNPTDTGTKAIFGTWLSRALNANNTGLLGELNSIEPYYSGHLNWLYEQELFNNSENPEAIIVKGYLFVILMMSDISYVPVEECTAEEVLACMDSDNYELCINICNDKTPPTCDVEFSTSSPTSGNVEAILTGCDESVTVTNNNGSTGYTFTGNGSFIFEFEDLAGNTGEKTAEVDWIDKEAPQCGTRTYSPAEASGLTNQNVTATLSRGDTGSGPSSASTGCDITGNNQTCSVVITDNAGNSTGCTSDIVTRIDRETITCDIEYSTTGWTNQTVTATLTGCNKTGITVLRPNGSWTYPFASNGNFTFEFRDAAGNTGSTNASVSWIDKDKPSCSISYETQGESGHESAIARLTGCNENIDVTNTSGNVKYYVLGASGTFTFQFKDRANNTGKANASYNIPKTTIQVRNSSEMKSFYISGNKAITCEYNYNTGAYSEKIQLYLKNGKVYQYSEYSGGDYDYYIYTKALFKDDRIFGWGTFFGSGRGIYADTGNFNEIIDSFFDSSYSGFVYTCSTGIDDDSVFNLPNGVIFYDEDDFYYHFSFDKDVEFSIRIDDTIKVGEYTDFTIKVTKDDGIYKDYSGTVIFALLDKNGDYVDPSYYKIAGNGFYDFKKSDKGKKTFTDGLRIDKAGTYLFQVEGLDGGIREEYIVVTGYDKGEINDPYKYNPKFSDEENEAFQFAHYYEITTKDSIKNANMYSGLTRIAMAKMLSQYAINVLGSDDFDTSRNCTFKDVSSSLDKQYDYGVTKACQLGIMGVNMANNKFYPNGYVTRAEFATALSRLLYNTKDGSPKYYSTHISKLYKEGIITKTDPTIREKRGFVMLMLLRATENYDD